MTLILVLKFFFGVVDEIFWQALRNRILSAPRTFGGLTVPFFEKIVFPSKLLNFELVFFQTRGEKLLAVLSKLSSKCPEDAFLWKTYFSDKTFLMFQQFLEVQY